MGWKLVCTGNPQICSHEIVCGDGYLNSDLEECDDGSNDFEGCGENCTSERPFFLCKHDLSIWPNSKCKSFEQLYEEFLNNPNPTPEEKE